MRSDIIHMRRTHETWGVDTEHVPHLLLWCGPCHMRSDIIHVRRTHETWGADRTCSSFLIDVVWLMSYEKRNHSYGWYTVDVGRKHRTCSSFIVMAWLMSYEKWHHSYAMYTWDVGRWHRTCSSFLFCGVAHVIWEETSFICDVNMRRGL